MAQPNKEEFEDVKPLDEFEGVQPIGEKTSSAETPPPKSVSAPERFRSSLASAVGVPEKMSDYGTGPAYMLRHPIDSAKMLWGAMSDAQQTPADAAVKEWREGNHPAASADALYSGIPLLGPLLSKAGHQLQQGDVAGGFGSMVGAAAPIITEKAPRVVRDIAPLAPRALETGGKVLANQSILDKPFKSVSSIGDYWRETSPQAKELARMKTEVENANIRKAYQDINDPAKQAIERGQASEMKTTVKEPPTPAQQAIREGRASKLSTKVPDVMASYVREGTAARIPLRVPRISSFGERGTPAAPEVNILPEPRQPFSGENTGYMASVPREELSSLATTRKPGAGAQLQQLGKPVIYVPNEAGYPGPRSSVLMNEFGEPMKPVSGGLGSMLPETLEPQGGRGGLPLNPTPEQMAKRPSAVPAPEYEYKPEGVKQDAGETIRSEKPPLPRGERRARVRTPEEEADTAAWIKARDAGDEPAMQRIEEKLARKSRNVTTNGSGESAASQEAINRVKSESTRGIKRYRIDTRSGHETPLIGVEAVDQQAGPYEMIVERGPRGETVLDQGTKARRR